MNLLPPICDFIPFCINRVDLIRKARGMILEKLAESKSKVIKLGPNKSKVKSEKTILSNLQTQLDPETQRLVLLALANRKKK